MLAGLGYLPSCVGVAQLYRDLIDGFVIDSLDRHLADAIEALGIQVLVTDTIMGQTPDRVRLAGEVLEFAATLSREVTGKAAGSGGDRR
jgi:LPPG:FO 2-phospho-L-lactate transferase